MAPLLAMTAFSTQLDFSYTRFQSKAAASPFIFERAPCRRTHSGRWKKYPVLPGGRGSRPRARRQNSPGRPAEHQVRLQHGQGIEFGGARLLDRDPNLVQPIRCSSEMLDREAGREAFSWRDRRSPSAFRAPLLVVEDVADQLAAGHRRIWPSCWLERVPARQPSVVGGADGQTRRRRKQAALAGRRNRSLLDEREQTAGRDVEPAEGSAQIADRFADQRLSFRRSSVASIARAASRSPSVFISHTPTSSSSVRIDRIASSSSRQRERVPVGADGSIAAMSLGSGRWGL